MLKQPVRRPLLVEIRKRRIRQRREDVIQDEAFHFGLRLFLFGPAVHPFDHVAQPDQQIAAFAFDPLAVRLAQVGTRDQMLFSETTL